MEFFIKEIMKKIFYGLPIIPMYIYGITVLTQYGYNSYFGIPSNFISLLSAQNFVFYFQLYQLGGVIAHKIQWWMWIELIFTALIIYSSYMSSIVWQWIIRVSGVVVFVYVFLHSYNLGQFVAQNTSVFYVSMNNCSLSHDQERYIIPSFYQDNAILVSIDENNILKGNMIIKKLSDLECGITKQNIGLIKQN